MSIGTNILREWRLDPVKFVRDVFKEEPDAWQHDVLTASGGDYQPVRRVGMKACTGPGKTKVLGWQGWHRLACYGQKGKHPKLAALSVSKDNLKDNLWAELGSLRKRSDFLMDQFEWTKERIYHKTHHEDWFMSARSFSKDADENAIGSALSGLHSAFPGILLDEIGDMPQAVGQKAEQIFTGSPIDAFIGAAGNPTSTTGLLYAITTQFRQRWFIVTITSDPDDPKRTPRVTKEFAQQQIDDYGRDNPWVMATILGIFPAQGFNSLIGLADMEKSMARRYGISDYNFAPRIIGVDVAREGNDKSTFCPRQGLVGFKPKVFRNAKSYILGNALCLSEDKWHPDAINIDGTGGWGAGVLDFGTQMGRTWNDVQYAGKSPDPKFLNMRAYIHFQFAEWIKNGGALPYLPELIKEACAITYSFQGGKFCVAPKEQIKKLIGCSTDYWDGYANTFAFPVTPKHRPTTTTRTQTEYNPVARAERVNFDYNPLGGGL